MATARNLRVSSSVGGKLVTETTATNVAELKAQIREQYKNIDDLTIVANFDGENREIDSNESNLLPKGETVRIFLMPKKTKSGSEALISLLAKKADKLADEHSEIVSKIVELRNNLNGASKSMTLEEDHEEDLDDKMFEDILNGEY